MKKIVHICVFERYREGAGYQENLLSKRHKDLGYDVYLIAQQKCIDAMRNTVLLKVGSYVNDGGVKVTILPSTLHGKWTNRFFDTCVGLYERLNEIKPDIMFVHNFTFKDVRHVVRYAKEHPELEVYVDCHSDYYNVPIKSLRQKIDAWRRRYFGQQLLKVAKKFWGTTPWRVEYLQDVYKIPANMTDVLIMGGDEKQIIGKDVSKIREDIRKQYQIPADAFLVVTGGTLDKRKQQVLLMEAIKNLKNENVWLLAFGKPTKEMEPVFAPYEKVDNIVMTGWLPSEKGYDMFLASDLAFFPGTHSVLWEQAVACGLPTVVRRWHGMEHVNVNGNVVFMDDVNVENIKIVICNLNDTPQYHIMKEKAEAAAPQFYLTGLAKKAIGILN